MKKAIFTLITFLFLGFAAQSQSISFTLTQAPCNSSGPDGIITATVTGLTPPLTYYWTSGGNQITQSNVPSLTSSISNYSGATLWLSVFGTSGSASGSYAGSPPFTYTTAVTNMSCPNLGSLNTTVTGGAAPYMYEYTDVSTNLVASTTNPASLPTGQYEVKITDNNGCIYGSLYNPDSLSIGQTNTFNVNSNITTANCTNGGVTINSVSGGTAPYSYSWSNASIASSISNVMSGFYNVNITDATNCSEIYYFNIPQAVTINVPTTPTPASCLNADGAAIAFGSGGTPPYSYLWNGTISSQSISNMPSGSYQVNVTDANGCTGQGFSYIGSSSPVYASVTQTPSNCTSPTGTATLSITGGVTPYTINWNTNPIQNGTTASNLAPGLYTYNIVDANGCINNGSVNVLPINQINVTHSTTPATCLQANGSINTNISGGTLPYTFLWSNTAATQNNTNISAGNYSFTVTDAIGCGVTKSINLTSTSPVNLGLSSTPTSCIYSNDGAITATPSGGTGPYIWNAGSASNPNLTQGNYYFSVTDANGCTATNFTNLGTSNTSTACYCTVSGTVYDDLNSNCTQDIGEVGIENIQIHCAPFGYTYTNASGYYEFKVPSGNYTVSQTVLTTYPLATCQNNSNNINVVASANCTQTINFANTINPIHDLKVNLWNWNLPVPGFNYKQKMLITNMGTINETSILTGYENDGQINNASIIPAAPIVSGSSVWYENSASPISLLPAATQSFEVNYTIPPTTPISTLLTFKDSVSYTALMSDWLNDYSPWDNVTYYTTEVVGPYDPNFKEVSPKGEGPNGNIFVKDSVLDYMIHFQNLGNYHAQNVVILDTLDANLDWTSLRPISQSHPCNITISENGVARFEFNNIMLPAKSINEPASHGMVSYEIKTKRNLPLGTQFKNKAEIYFDFNAPIVTNTTINTIVAPSSVEDNKLALKNNELAVFPNPTSENLFVSYKAQSNEKVMASITDISGKIIYSTVLTTQKGTQIYQFDTGSFSDGIYFITLSNEHEKRTAKFLKTK